MVPVAVGPELVEQHVRRDPRQVGLRHLLATHREIAVGEDVTGQREAGGHEQRRPDDRMVAQDVLADDVVVGRPRPLEALRVRAESHCGDVVLQRVDPHVHHVAQVPGDRDAPAERRPRHRQVLQAGPHEGKDLVAAALWRHEVRLRLVELDQPVPVGGEPEEVVVLLQHHHGALVDRAEAVDDLGGLVEALAGHAVRSLVLAEVDVALVVELLRQPLHRADMALLRGADEVVVGDLEPLPDLLPAGHDPVGPRLRIEPGCGGRQGHLLAVLVGSGEKVDPLAAQAVVARQEICGNRGVSVPDMGNIVHVIDRSCQVERVFGRHGV